MPTLLTGEDRLSHALPCDVALLFAPSRERSLKHKPTEIVGPLKPRRSVLQHVLREVRLHVSDLYVGVVGGQ